MEKRLKILYFQDPGHGWCRVPVALVQKLKLEVSPYSYHDKIKGFVYLEEDDDAPKFYAAMKKAGLGYELCTLHTDEESPIRTLPVYESRSN